MKQHLWLENGDGFRLLPTADARVESIITVEGGIHRFAAHLETVCTEILITWRGKVRVFQHGRSAILSEGEGTLFLPGEVRGYRMEEGENGAFSCLRMRGVRGGNPERSLKHEIFSLRNCMEVVRLACDMIREAAHMPAGCAREVGRNALNSLLCVVNDAQSSLLPDKGQISQAVATAISYIDMNYIQAPTMEQIAGSCYLSTSRLSSLMKKETDFSPFDYVIERRIGDAQQRLMYSTSAMGEIARLVGYPEPSSFSAAFHKRIGISPEGFRKIFGIYGGEKIHKR